MESALQKLKDLATTIDEAGRQKALDTLRELTIALETPHDALQRLSGVHLPTAVVRAAIDMRLFNILADSKKPMSAEEVAQQADAAELLTARLLRYLAAYGMVDEVGKNSFAASKKTVAFASPAYQGGICHYFETVAPTVQNIPAFLAETKNQNITDNSKTPFNKAHQTDLPGFMWFQTQPQKFKWFNDYMPVQREGMPDWLSVFPVESEYSSWGKSGKDAVFVDVGGGFGHQSAAFRQKYPDLPGRIIVQDVPQAIEHVAPNPAFETMAQNFFEPQAVKGAKFYYMRNILHDYPDKQCLTILENTIAAMDAKSVILIDEMVLPDKGVSWEASQTDLIMMFSLGSIERTREQWYALLQKAGLEVKQIYPYTTSLNDSIILAVPKSS